MKKPVKKLGEIWIKTANIGDFMEQTKRSKTQYNKGAGNEIVLLIYEYNVSLLCMCQAARPAQPGLHIETAPGFSYILFDLYTQCILSAIYIDTPDAYETSILQVLSGFCPDFSK